MLYEQKIDKNNIEHIKMLFDIWKRFNKNDYNINIIDQKWSKYINLLFIQLKLDFKGKTPSLILEAWDYQD